MFGANLGGRRDAGASKKARCCSAATSRELTAAKRGRERDGVVVHIEVGGLIMGGMEECTEGRREGGKERGRGGGHLPLREEKKISPGSAN